MRIKDFDTAYRQVQNGDFFSISVLPNYDLLPEIAGTLIEYGTGGQAHIGIVTDKEHKKSVEATDKGTVETCILNYRGRKNVCITFWRLKDITSDNVTTMLTYVSKIVTEKHPYDWGTIARMAGRSLLSKIPILGYWIGQGFSHLKFWGDNPKYLFCSEVCTMFARVIVPDFRKGYEPNQVTPTLFCQSSKLIQISVAGFEA